MDTAMKVDVRISDLQEAMPDLIPAFRSLGESLPNSVCVEACMTVAEEQERKMRVEHPLYWSHLTMIEWRLFVQLFVERDCDRRSLRAIMHGETIGVSEEGDYLTSNVVDVHVKNLRKKLRGLGDMHHILTKRGWGYLFRDGKDPMEHSKLKSAFDKTTRIKEKQLNPDGSLKQHPWRTNRNRLNAVEFGYLKEMKMDEVSKEEAGRILKLSGADFDRAWDAPDFDHYSGMVGHTRSRRTSGPRVCGSCHQPGHYKQTCPNV